MPLFASSGEFPLQRAIQGYGAPLLFVEEIQAHHTSVIGGTGLFLQTPHGRFFLTALHVWTAFLRRANEDGGRAAIVIPDGDTFISLRDALIAGEDHDRDLVLLKSETLSRRHLKTKMFYSPKNWPIPAPRDKETLGFIGYPGEIRKTKGLGIAVASWYLEHPCWIGASGRCLIPGTNLGEERVQVNHVPDPPEIASVGGSSGAPVFALRDGTPILVGIVTDGSSDQGLQSTLQVETLGHLAPDGSFSVT